MRQGELFEYTGPVLRHVDPLLYPTGSEQVLVALDRSQARRGRWKRLGQWLGIDTSDPKNWNDRWERDHPCIPSNEIDLDAWCAARKAS